MNVLELLAYILGANSVAMALAIFVVVRQYPQAIRRALLVFAGGKMLVGVAFTLIGSRGAIPDLLSIVVGNVLAIAGTFAPYSGARILLNKPTSPILVSTLVGVAAVGVFYFTAIDPDLRGTRAITSLVGAIVYGVLAHELLILYRRPGLAHIVAGITSLVLMVMMAVRLIGVFTLSPLSTDQLSGDMIEKLFFVVIYFGATVGTISFVLMSNDAFNRELSDLVSTDELTHTTSRRSLLLRGEAELRRASRYRRGLSVMLIDIDHFKKINDTLGHSAGDITLRQVADSCVASVRDIDLVGRLGGEEFVVLMPDTDLAAAIEVAERLRRAVEALTILDAGGSTLKVTVSVGVAELNGDADFEALLRRADLAMYRAKGGGRNQVQVAAGALQSAPVPSM